MQSSRNLDAKHEDVAQKGIFALLFSKAYHICQYVMSHKADTINFLLCLNAARVLHNYYNNREVKYSLDTLHTAYRGPSFIYFDDKTFDPARDLVGWTTDVHSSGYYDTSVRPYTWHEVTNSFNTERFSEKDQEGLFNVRLGFYSWCMLESLNSGYGNILSHRSIQSPSLQSTFGFYGKKNLEEIIKYHKLDTGFVVGIRAFGNQEYHSQTQGNVSYQLAKIDLKKIDMTQVGYEYNSSPDIVHVYIIDGEVRQHPVRDRVEHLDCVKNWTRDCYDKYIGNLPNFASTVDWVIAAPDLTKGMNGEMVTNLLKEEEINIVNWQKQQEKIANTPLKDHGLFALPRPRDYHTSFEYKAGQSKLKPPLLFKIAKEPDSAKASKASESAKRKNG